MLFAVRRFGGEFQLLVDFIQEVLGFLSVTFHIPLVGLLSRGDFFISLLAQPLGGRQVRMACRGHISLGLGDDGSSNYQQGAKNGCECSGFQHMAFDYT